MFNSLADDLYFSQKIKIKQRFSNEELLLFQYFKRKTKIFLDNVIMINDFIFFFVKVADYFRAKIYQHVLRRDFMEKRIVIISLQETLIEQIFSFFPDAYIHNFKMESYGQERFNRIILYFLSYEERGIAVGRGGDYIKAVNEIFQKIVVLEGFFQKQLSITLQCELTDLKI